MGSELRSTMTGVDFCEPAVVMFENSFGIFSFFLGFAEMRDLSGSLKPGGRLKEFSILLRRV